MGARAEPKRGQARCYLIVQDGEVPVAWLQPNAAGWQLPSVEVTNSSGFSNTVETIRETLAGELGVDAQVLCHVYDYWPPGAGQEQMVAVVEVVRDSLPLQWQPMTAERVRSVSFANREHRDLLQRWLWSIVPDNRPVERVAWAIPGWRSDAEDWIKQQLAALGAALTERMSTRKMWSLSCVLRVPTDLGDFYFKAVPPLFKREPALTEALARRHPGQVPEVVALDTAQGWMLTRAFAAQSLQQTDDLRMWEEAVRGYADIQRAWIDDIEILGRLGCPDRGPLQLAEQIDDLLADRAALGLGQPRGLSQAEWEQLHALAPRMKEACQRWATSGIPLSLEHGDLHGENIAVRSAKFTYFDWTDGCIAHPFVFLTTFLERADSQKKARLTRTYLDCWRDFASADQLEATARLARPLGAMHLAVSYWEIHRASEPMQRWQLAGAEPLFLKAVLEHQIDL